MKRKILIIKTGYSETLDPEISTVTSYGDVLRTTVLLHLYQKDQVTWLVDEHAYPILKNCPFVDRVLIYNLSTVLQLQSELFDVVINLEKVPGLCALADKIQARRHYGFSFNASLGEAEAHPDTQQVYHLCQNPIEKKRMSVVGRSICMRWLELYGQGKNMFLGCLLMNRLSLI